ncbi:MAG TPA: hypothetical protein VM431_07070 [Phycisphaerae bacterium]|nr:hypothetical protein [Phycisphaerae bacterium]
MTQGYLTLLDQVHLVRRMWRVRRVVEGLLLAAALVVGAAAIVTALDQAADFGPLGRWVLALALWTTLIGAGWYRVVRPAVAPHTDDYFAALMEKRLPSLGNRLINALQLGREDEPQAPRLVEAIVADGIRVVDDVDPGRTVSGPGLARGAVSLAAALLVAVAYVLWAGPAAETHLMRVLLPGADIAPFTWTRLAVDVEPGDRLLEGSPLTVRATTAGRLPDEALLHWTDAADRRRLLRLEAEGGGKFAHTFPALDTALEFYVTAGDAESPRFRVAVDRRPRIEAMSVVYTYPAYAELPERTVDDFDGHLHGLPGTQARLTLRANKPMKRLALAMSDGPQVVAAPADTEGLVWTIPLTLQRAGTYRLHLGDTQGYELEVPATYTVTLQVDGPPAVAFARPGRDLQRMPEGKVDFLVVAQDDLGLGPVTMVGRTNGAEPKALQAWPSEGAAARRVDLPLARTVAELGLKGGDRLQYWAVAEDRRPGTPGRAETRKFHLLVLTPEQGAALLERQLADYAKVITELIRLQRLNRSESAEAKPAGPLVDRQSLIRRQTQQLADVMQRSAFPAQTIVDALRELAAGPMAQVIGLLESYRDAVALEEGKGFARQSLPVQDQIVEALEELLLRLNRTEQVRRYMKKLKDGDPVKHGEVKDVLAKVADDLDKFLNDVKEIEEKYEKLPKRRDDEEVTGEGLPEVEAIEHRLDRWKKWFKDSVDAITKLPDGFVADAFLSENVSTIFEEIEKQARPPTVEIATPVEEGAKALAEEVAEDLEMWMPDIGDNLRWVMEDPIEGTFDVPEAKLPSSLQDMIGDLIEDLEDFDEEADDVTGAWGGNMQVGWGIADGPISSYAALGKTGNQLPNASEMGGRSGSGRRGRATGQMVGAESRGLEGRPTPARLTNERYEAGTPKADKQLDPRGATGGGKKTGGGRRGLQGGTPPDFVSDMERLAKNQALLREKAQKVARELEFGGRPLGGVQRAIELMKGVEGDLRDLRYDDAARKRKMAVEALREAASQVDQAVNLSLQKAPHLSPELRDRINAGAQQALPEGFEDIVGAYYKALSRDADQ